MRLKSNRGSVTIVAFLLMGMLLLLGMAVMKTSDDEVTIAGNEMQEMRAFYAAEAGLERATASLQTEYDSTGLPTLSVPEGEENINGCAVSYSAQDNGPATQRPLSQGELAGLNALVKEYSIVSTGVSSTDNAQVELSRKLEAALVPIFQFAVFYGNDLEIAPGADMTLMGRVHSNGNLYLQANTSLKMESFVTASGNIYYGRKGPGSAGGGDVQIKNGTGAYVSMKDGSGWLDAHDSYWYNESIARWQGRVRDESHGVKELNLPLSGADEPHKIIERAAGNPDSYENKATLIIKDGVVRRKNSSGVWQDVTAAMTAAGAITYTNNKFYDQREAKWVDCTEIDVKKMNDNGYGPTNGVVYFSDEISGASDWPALRLTNGSELGGGLTVASENPLYTLGDFNSVNKKPVSLMADAVTFLSNQWKAKNFDTL
ncbi:MAG: PilX N-terminal domain-containing pilus assembly protein, partial [candidate division Zixibacteria bacterium]|nr:PilX N-terminal domain-containing pilus assembly protein [candidate division Zixibacteria bacterium]